MKANNLTIVLTGHNEGYLIHRTLRSIQRSRLFAEERGLKIELILVLDAVDEPTRQYVKRDRLDFRIDNIIVTHYNAVGLARNEAIKVARSNVIAICDGDDLFCENWFYDSWKLASSNPTFIYHPEYKLAFGNQRSLIHYSNQNDPNVDLTELVGHHFWSSNITAHRSIFMANPYSSTSVESGFGYEDWHFNVEGIMKGYQHRVVPRTIRIYNNMRAGSLNVAAIKTHSVVAPSSFFTSKYFHQKLTPVINEKDSHQLLVKLHHAIIAPMFPKLSLQKRIRLSKLTILIKQVLGLPLKAQEIIFKKQKHFLKITDIPKWIIKETNIQSEIESRAFIKPDLKLAFYESALEKSLAAVPYIQLLKVWPVKQQYSHLFLMPRLSLGGAEYFSLAIIKTLAKQFQAKILIVITSSDNLEWRDRLPINVTVINVSSILQDLPDYVQHQILVRILIQHQPERIIIANDSIGWGMMANYARQLSAYSQLTVWDFLYWPNEYGMKSGYGRDILPKIHVYINNIITDNKTYAQYLQRYLGCSKKLIHVLNTPVETAQPASFDLKATNILWAARFDKQKRLDILYNIALRLPGYDFYIYGRPVIDQLSSQIKQLKRLPNVHFKGTFERLEELWIRPYRCFLHTADTEGIPVMLLNMMTAGLPIVASAVGGVNEIINTQTGFPIKQIENISAYVDTIVGLAEQPELVNRLLINANQTVTKYHSEAYLQQQLARLPKFTGLTK